jgi:hypothetical protein
LLYIDVQVTRVHGLFLNVEHCSGGEVLPCPTDKV